MAWNIPSLKFWEKLYFGQIFFKKSKKCEKEVKSCDKDVKYYKKILPPFMIL